MLYVKQNFFENALQSAGFAFCVATTIDLNNQKVQFKKRKG